MLPAQWPTGRVSSLGLGEHLKVGIGGLITTDPGATEFPLEGSMKLFSPTLLECFNFALMEEKHLHLGDMPSFVPVKPGKWIRHSALPVVFLKTNVPAQISGAKNIILID